MEEICERIAFDDRTSAATLQPLHDDDDDEPNRIRSQQIVRFRANSTRKIHNLYHVVATTTTNLEDKFDLEESCCDLSSARGSADSIPELISWPALLVATEANNNNNKVHFFLVLVFGSRLDRSR